VAWLIGRARDALLEGNPLKIRNPVLLNAASWLCTFLVRSLGRTVRVRTRHIGENYFPDAPNLNRRAIYLFWHENMLLPSFNYAKPDIHVLISTHADGQFVGKVMKRLGLGMVHGSITRGGVEAIRHLVELSKESHFVITPDGPRGPRRKVKMGAVFLAAQTGMPIVPCGCGYGSALRFKSWDRFAFPRPFSRAYGVITPPIFVPAGLAKDRLEAHRREVEDKLLAATAIAERWAATGQYDTYDYDILSPRSNS
jgi:lysophospholipid acyltransferase (LPLAT)-like uncharacterized protein